MYQESNLDQKKKKRAFIVFWEAPVVLALLFKNENDVENHLHFNNDKKLVTLFFL